MMKTRYFLLTDAQAGDYGGHGLVSKEEIPSRLPAPGDGQFYVELPGHLREWTVALVDGAVMPARRVTSAEKQRAADWEAVKAERLRKERSGASTPFGWVDTTPEAIARIQMLAVGALIAKQAGKPFEVDFTMADNRAVTLDADGVLAVSEAVTAHILEVHTAAQAKRRT